MGKRSKKETEIESVINRLVLSEKIVKAKLKVAKKLAKKQGIDIKSQNIVEVTRKKLKTEIIPYFKDAGIDFYQDSIVTNAVMNQIKMYLKKGEDFLQNYYYTLVNNVEKNKTQCRKNQSVTQLPLKNSSRMPKIFERIRNIFSRGTKMQDEKIEYIRENISLYEKATNSMESYSLRENIAEAIVNKICPEQGVPQLGSQVEKLINKEIEPVLKKLGLQDLEAELYVQIKARYQVRDAQNTILDDSCKMFPSIDKSEGIPREQDMEGFEPYAD